MNWITTVFPVLKPYEFAIKLLGALAIILSIMGAGAFLMHDRDEAVYQKEKARAAEDAKKAQDAAIADAIKTAKADHQREMQTAQELHQQQLKAANLKLAAAQDTANHAGAYACKLSDAGYQILMEAFQ